MVSRENKHLFHHRYISYTRLDVHKRVDKLRYIIKIEKNLREEIFKRGIEAVYDLTQ